MPGKGAALGGTEQPIDTSTAAGKAFLDMLGVFAEFETKLRRERQLEGIAKAKAAGVYKGGTRRIDREAVRSLRREGKGPTEIAKALGISRMHAYRLVKAMEGGGSGGDPGKAPRAGFSLKPERPCVGGGGCR